MSVLGSERAAAAPNDDAILQLSVERLPSPIGSLRIVSDALGRLRALDFDDYEPRHLRLLERHYGSRVRVSDRPAPSAIRRQVEAYFDGQLAALDAIAVATAGTPFQQSVWAALRTIPPGQTLSYAALAARIGRPRAVRAVGLANGSNPIGIVVPCHRVIGANGSLTGYGGGIDRKRWLLAHEGAAHR